MSCRPESKGMLISLKLDAGSEANVVPETVVLAVQKKPQMVESKPSPWLHVENAAFDTAEWRHIHIYPFEDVPRCFSSTFLHPVRA